jgi:Fe-S cluster biogenesis protein NfuA
MSTVEDAEAVGRSEVDVAAAGDRVEKLLGELAGFADPRVGEVAEELVRTLVGLYGAALERIAGLVDGESLIADPLVESLLLVHDLHPQDADTRIQRALDRVRPYLGSHSGGVDYLGVDAETGVVRLRLEGSCQGCPASTETARGLLETAVLEAAPETSGIEIEGVTEASASGLLQIGAAPAYLECPPVPAARIR